MLTRRSIITGLISLAAAPAIVRATSLMPVKVMRPTGPTVVYVKLWDESFMSKPNGSVANPFRTIKDALDHVRLVGFDQTEIHLAPGVYRESVEFPDGKHSLVSSGPGLWDMRNCKFKGDFKAPAIVATHLAVVDASGSDFIIDGGADLYRTGYGATLIGHRP